MLIIYMRTLPAAPNEDSKRVDYCIHHPTSSAQHHSTTGRYVIFVLHDTFACEGKVAMSGMYPSLHIINAIHCGEIREPNFVQPDHLLFTTSSAHVVVRCRNTSA